jgi:hypothetical protein
VRHDYREGKPKWKKTQCKEQCLLMINTHGLGVKFELLKGNHATSSY